MRQWRQIWPFWRCFSLLFTLEPVIKKLKFINISTFLEALKCYTDADSHRKEVPCAKGEEQCYLSLGKHDKDMSPRAYGCIDKEEEAECQSPGCTMCDTDLCNSKTKIWRKYFQFSFQHCNATAARRRSKLGAVLMKCASRFAARMVGFSQKTRLLTLNSF